MQHHLQVQRTRPLRSAELNFYRILLSRLFSSEQVGKAKPAPDLHLHIAEQYDVQQLFFSKDFANIIND